MDRNQIKILYNMAISVLIENYNGGEALNDLTFLIRDRKNMLSKNIEEKIVKFANEKRSNIINIDQQWMAKDFIYEVEKMEEEMEEEMQEEMQEEMAKGTKFEGFLKIELGKSVLLPDTINTLLDKELTEEQQKDIIDFLKYDEKFLIGPLEKGFEEYGLENFNNILDLIKNSRQLVYKLMNGVRTIPITEENIEILKEIYKKLQSIKGLSENEIINNLYVNEEMKSKICDSNGVIENAVSATLGIRKGEISASMQKIATYFEKNSKDVTNNIDYEKQENNLQL